MSAAITSPDTIALLGGTFDPPHVGHLWLAQDIVERGGFKRLIFIPTGRNPLKSEGPGADGMHRLGMLKAAIGDDPRFGVLDLELRRPPPSYTIDTVRELRALYPEARLVFVIGADQSAMLPRWHAIDLLVREVEFLILARPGFALVVPELPGLRWRQATARLVELSSTEVRRRLTEGMSVDFFLPRGVLTYIQQHNLYLP